MKRQIVFAFAFLSVLSNSYSQTTVTIGTGTIVNAATNYPAPYGNWYWGAKQQFLIKATELTALGMSAGNITELAFNVSNDQGVALNGFNVALKNTATNNLTAFENGATTVYGPQAYTEFNGWNTHVFTTPFYWDGVSNLLISTCFNNNSYTQNAQVFQSTTSFASSAFYYSDAPNNCAQIAPSQSMNQRPNMKLTFVPNNVPPVTNFSVSSTSNCTGLISFFDMSTNFPTSWLWDFGDGNTSTLQNPTNNYSGNGTYTVSLISYNAFGSDTLIMTNYIIINSATQLPIASSCIPATQNGSFGFGITNFSLNTINNSSSDASAGYEDFVCVQTNLYVGQNYPISYEHSTPSTHNSAVWIDFNNDGILDDVTERVFSVNNALTASGSIYISSSAVLNTPLRLRVWADYDFSNPPSPCGNPDYGQAEDYTVIIVPNPLEPEALFSVDDANTCTGIVCFDDQSLNIPTSWNWNFGDGNNSVLQFPCHTYLTDGIFDVTLIVTNANGDDTLVFSNAVTVNTASIVTTPSCTPSTLGYCCGYGIYKVEFNTINNTTNDGIEGYMDYSCDAQTTVTEGQFYFLEVRTGIDNAQDTRVWIDFNNDGIFDVSELIMDSPNDFDPSANINIPTGSVLNTPLRMRVSSDVIGTPQLGCTNNDFGQTEDYAVIILSNSIEPFAFFSATPTVTCNDPIQFSDLSTNAPTSWFWDFGDGNTSTQQNPQHTYTNTGTYNVTLIVTNANGDDTLIQNNYITIDCSTILMPVSGTEFYSNCSGTVYDNGGASSNYSDNTNGIIVIEPPSATSIILAFTFFDFVASTTGDTLYVYDGNSISSPLLGAFSGNVMPPNIISSSGALTLRQKTNGTATDPGFVATWNCILGMDEWNEAEINAYPNPAQHQIFITSPAPVNYTLFDQLGQLIISEVTFSKNFTIDINSLPNGIYFIEMNGEKQNRIMKKIIVQK